jgi:hypothetical protein
MYVTQSSMSGTYQSLRSSLENVKGMNAEENIMKELGKHIIE